MQPRPTHKASHLRGWFVDQGSTPSVRHSSPSSPDDTTRRREIPITMPTSLGTIPRNPEAHSFTSLQNSG